MNSKKALPLIIIASMILSLLPSVFIAHATLGFTNFYSVVDKVETTTIVTNTVKGNVVAATGLGVAAGTTVQLYWDDTTHAWDGISGLVNSTKAGSDGTFDIWFTVPEATNGSHNVWFKDGQGNTMGPEPLTIDATVSLSPSTGLPGDTITAKMYGYPKSAVIGVTFNGNSVISDLDANSLGTASSTFKVPTGTTYGTYPVVATNATTTASADLVVGPVITVSATSAAVGSVITIQGRGFITGQTISQGDVFIADGLPVQCFITSPTTLPMTVDSTGRIRLNIVVPQVDSTGDYTMNIDSTAGTSSTDFTVSALAKVSVTPDFAPVASSITVSGVNYPKVSGVVIQVDLNSTSVGTVKTLSDGTFSKVFKVPAAGEGSYKIYAYNVDYHITDNATFKVGTMNLILSDNSAATGTTISISANGFTHGGEWNATFGTKTLDILGYAPADGSGLITGASFQVPQLPVGTYTITVWDITAEISLTTQFQVSSTTSVTLSVPSAPNTYNVTFLGNGFSDSMNGSAVDFVIYNKTSTGALDFWTTMTVWNLPKKNSGQCWTNSSGQFYGYWIVGAATDVDLTKGNYWMNITDASGNYAVTLPFAVGDIHAVCTPRKTSFAIGETITFVIQHSFGGQVGSVADGSYVNVYDPSKNLVFSGDLLSHGSWVKTGLYYTLPYSAQTAGGNPMLLQDDAPTGNWTYKWFDSTSDHALITSGTFTVAASAVTQTDAQIAALSQQLTDLKTQVTGVTTAVQGIQTAATAAQTTATAAQTSAAAAKTSADAALAAATTAGTNANAATTAANAAKTSADSAASAANNLTTLVYGAIGASIVAALAAIVALMQISRKIA
jgi:hypothetical protein